VTGSTAEISWSAEAGTALVPIRFHLIWSGLALSLSSSLRPALASRSSNCGPVPQNVRPLHFGSWQVWLISAPWAPITAAWIVQPTGWYTQRSRPLDGSMV